MKYTSSTSPHDQPNPVRKLTASMVIAAAALGASGCAATVDAIASSVREETSTAVSVSPAVEAEKAAPDSAVQGRFRLGEFDVKSPDYEFFNVCKELTPDELLGMGLESNGIDHERDFKNFELCGFRNIEKSKAEVAYTFISDELAKEKITENFLQLDMPFESLNSGAYFHSPFLSFSDFNCSVSISTNGGRLGVTALGSGIGVLSLEELCVDADQKMATILNLKGIS